MTEAIGQPEHPGRVRGVGRGLGIQDNFGPHPRDVGSTSLVFNSPQIEAIKLELTKEIREQVMWDISSMPTFSQQHPNFPVGSPNTTKRASKNGRCSTMPHIQEDEEDIPEECELYVDKKHHVVAYGNVYKLGPTIHNQLLDNDMARLVVTKVLDSNAQVPMPTYEVTKVGEALNNFIQWPKRLLCLVTNKDVKGNKEDVLPSKRSEPKHRGAAKLMLKIMSRKDALKFKLEGDTFVYLPIKDLMELCMKTQDLRISILRIWMVAINGYNRSKGSRKQRKPTWNISLKCQRQSFNYEYGYYVMIHMLNIVSAGIVNSWNEIFGDSTPFHEDDVTNVQERCANFILESI
ncbi:hypothetical protein KIW84_075586 [Lathyrus oleraceus]|uniref:DUF8039 domain-containing protein n=1 Tax=Pisum sativum TaxID=3888 RepID=A0A9D4VUD7_PEA|nr:hypothetical protein KIW84_075586 [Pisum sativum]